MAAQGVQRSILELGAEEAAEMSRAELRDLACEEIAAVEGRARTEGRRTGLLGAARNTVVFKARDLGLGCLNVLLPFLAPGCFLGGHRWTGVAQVLLCAGALAAGYALSGWWLGLLLCYAAGVLFCFLVSLGEKLRDARACALALREVVQKGVNPYVPLRSLACPEHFASRAFYEEYVAWAEVCARRYEELLRLCGR